MRTLKIFFAMLSLSIFIACGGAQDRRAEQVASKPEPAQLSEAESKDRAKGQLSGSLKHVSLQQADQTQSVTEAMNRKIIQDAQVALEVDSPLDTQRSVTSIAESNGGFVVTSESKLRQADDPSQRVMDVTLTIRVPSSQFGPARDAILALSKQVLENKSTGQDVTEEFIDLEARVKTQRALEAQFLEIMKQAREVVDALEVQRQIAEVRTEIEKLEGRKRFLENRSSLSTITVNLKAPTTVVVTPTGFGRDVKEAVKESIEIARGILLFLIRFVIVMIPIFLLILLPLGLVLRYMIRRARRPRVKAPTTAEAPAPVQST